MPELKSEHISRFSIDLPEGLDLGETPVGHRVVFDILGGRFEGRLSGELLRSGADWMLVDRDGTCRLDVREVLRLDDGSLAYIQLLGRLVLPQDVRAMTRADRAALDPSKYYFRVAPTYETSSAKYHWLNGIQAVAVCWLTATGIGGDLFEIL